MKFMKLGSKPDAFQADDEGNSIRCISSELATDLTIIVDEVKFYLHKFPLLSKSNRFQKLALNSTDHNNSNSDTIHLPNFPGGPKAFELCAKFCYGITISLSPYNLVSTRCAAEYLEMTEDIDNGNLIFKVDVFFKSSILHSWKDSIIVLQTTKAFLPWSEDIGIAERCIDSIAMKTSLDLSSINWTYTYNRKLNAINKINEISSVPKDWWVEDLTELDIDLYKRVILGIKSKKKVEGNVIGEALKTYCLRWLPDFNGGFELNKGEALNYKSLIETIIRLIPSDCSCSFLLKLLKIAIFVGVEASVKEDLMNNISLKLNEASVQDLLIPAQHPETTVYDIKLAQSLVEQFFVHESKKKKPVKKMISVGHLINGYLTETGRDQNLDLASFINLARSVSDSARPVHDGLYGAIDAYLKEHTKLTKSEKKKLCELIDVKKLSSHACMHAVQNERLPLRMAVQILFHEQVNVTARNDNVTQGGEWGDIKVRLRSKSLRAVPTCNAKIKEEEERKMELVPSRSWRFFDRFWGNAESKSVGTTSGSSQSKSSSSSSRKQRYSVS